MDRFWEHINCSQTQEFENWDCRSTFPFLEIHKWDFRCRVDKQAECTCRQAENIQDRLLAGRQTEKQAYFRQENMLDRQEYVDRSTGRQAERHR